MLTHAWVFCLLYPVSYDRTEGQFIHAVRFVGIHRTCRHAQYFPFMQYTAIDAMKLFFAICVVGIHANATGLDVSPYGVNYVVNLAVPFFFAVSGFLMAGKTHDMPDGGLSYYQKSFRRNLRLYVLYLVIYLPLAFVHYFVKHPEFGCLGSLLRYVHGIIIAGETPCAWPLWYLYALVLGTGTVMLAVRRRISIVRLWVVSSVVFVVLYHVQCNGIAHVCEPEQMKGFFCLFVPMRYFRGLMLLTTGLVLGNTVRSGKTGLMGIALLAVSVGFYALSVTTGIDTAFWFWAGGAAMLLIALNRPASKEKRECFLKMRTLSTICYFFHMYFIVILRELDNHWHFNLSPYGLWVAATVGVLVFGFIFDAARKHKRLQWLNHCLQ